MKRVIGIKHAGEWDAATAADRIVLDAAARHRRRAVLTGERGTCCLIDLAQPVMLKDGDGLVLDDGAVLRIVGEAEPLVELVASTPLQFVRLAWHLGNRHADVQIAGDRLRIRRDHVLEEMASGLGVRISTVEAPFEPESAASREHGHGHDHGA
jgi:urease accessory protein